MEENYYVEIRKKVNEFCSIQPHKTKQIDYLFDAEKIKNLYLNSVELAENGDEGSDELQQIYKDICKIIED